MVVWFSINATETAFRMPARVRRVLFPLSQPCRFVPRRVFFALLGASVFEGELRDGGFVQITFPECNEFLILIVGRLS